MSLLIDSLNNIFSWLETNNPAIADSLQPGLSYQTIEEKVASFPFHLPQELYELYQWRNGTPEDSKSDTIDFFLNYRFLPLEESIKIRLDILEHDSWIIDSLFPYAWFPIFTFEGEYYSVIGSEKPRYSSPIIYIYHEETIDYISLTAMIQTIAECYKSGAYYLDDNGYYDRKKEDENKIILKYNLGVTISSYYSNYNPEIINKSKGIKIVNNYNEDRSYLISTEIKDARNNLRKSIRYLGGRIIRRQTSNIKEKFCYNNYVIEERFSCDRDKHESQIVATRKSWFKWQITHIKRRYINDILKKETIDTKLETKLCSLIGYFIVFAIGFWIVS